jgi:hypothetical protein
MSKVHIYSKSTLHKYLLPSLSAMFYHLHSVATLNLQSWIELFIPDNRNKFYFIINSHQSYFSYTLLQEKPRILLSKLNRRSIYNHDNDFHLS